MKHVGGFSIIYKSLAHGKKPQLNLVSDIVDMVVPSKLLLCVQTTRAFITIMLI